MDYGITSYGAHVPRLRLSRDAVSRAHRWMTSPSTPAAKGARAFCSWDEDTITMAVEAARDCLPPQMRAGVEQITLATTTAPYADMSNATIVANALGLPPRARTREVSGCQRAGVGALIDALEAGGGDRLVIGSEQPKARPASAQELQFGAGAAAFRTGAGSLIARKLGAACVSAAFPDHVRAAGADLGYYWEERWVRDEGYAKLVPAAIAAALEDAGLEAGDIDHFVMPALIRGAPETVARAMKMRPTIADGLADDVGFAGAAHPLLMLAQVLETADAGARILVVGFGQGADALILEATGRRAEGGGVSRARADKIVTEDYLRFLSFAGLIDLDWGMRAETSEKAALTAAWRESEQLASFQAGRCAECGAIQFPQLAFCVSPGCGAPAARFEPVSLADEAARLVTVTSDWLSYHPAPPLHVGFVQFEKGARLMMEIVDASAGTVDVGIPLRMVFRLKKTDPRNGYRRYFWKATPAL